jgi:hypothetical protein
MKIILLKKCFLILISTGLMLALTLELESGYAAAFTANPEKIDFIISGVQAINLNGEGKTYIGYITTNANGNFSGSLSVGSCDFTQITGTATDSSNNTSEFGPNRPVTVTAVKLLSFAAAWEIARGLNPAVNNAGVNRDGDGISNGLEYARGTDPFNPDSDSDGISDGAEEKHPDYLSRNDGTEGVRIQTVATDAGRVTLEFVVKSFDVAPSRVGGEEFERLRLPDCMHGLTQEAGRPQLPIKVLLPEVPAGKPAKLNVLAENDRVNAGYRVYPAPGHRLGENGQLEEVFVWDEAGYRVDAFYPYAAAETSTPYVYRSQVKQRLIFNPVAGMLRWIATVTPWPATISTAVYPLKIITSGSTPCRSACSLTPPYQAL